MGVCMFFFIHTYLPLLAGSNECLQAELLLKAICYLHTVCAHHTIYHIMPLFYIHIFFIKTKAVIYGDHSDGFTAVYIAVSVTQKCVQFI